MNTVGSPNASSAGTVVTEVMKAAGVDEKVLERYKPCSPAAIAAVVAWLAENDPRVVEDDCRYEDSPYTDGEWSDEQAFQDFIRSDAFRNVTNWGKEQILSGRPQHKVYKS